MSATMRSLVSSKTTVSAGPRPSRVACSASAMQRVQMAAATVALSAGLIVAPALADGVKFSNVVDGARVQSPVHLEFQVEGLSVKAAAEGLVEGTGHFHVLIDEKAPAAGDAIPFDETHKHYGKGQLADDIVLTPGKHTVTLQFANAQHLSYGSKFAKTVTLNVTP